MKIELLNKNVIYKPKELNKFELNVISDLELNEIFKAASNNEKFLFDTFKSVLMDLSNKDTILYRQMILKDIVNNKKTFYELYDFIVTSLMDLGKNFRFGIIKDSPSKIVQTSKSILNFLLASAIHIKDLVNSVDAKSEGLIEFIKDCNLSFDNNKVSRCLKLLEPIDFTNGVMKTAGFDELLNEINTEFNISTLYDKEGKKRWKKAVKITFDYLSEGLSKELDKNLDTALEAIYLPVGRASESLLEYFYQLRFELGFYIASLNLINKMEELGFHYSFPNIIDNGIKYDNLYDLALSLKMNKLAIANSHQYDKKLMVITGANQGGKTTYLRSLGQSILLSQAGIIVPAKDFNTRLFDNIYTHFDKEEDVKMESGRLDEELSRISNIINCATKDSIIVLNEPFQSTNEHEGSMLGIDIIGALIDSNINTIVVTHIYELAMKLLDEYKDNAYYLRASRLEDGTRNFILCENKPLETSFGMDLYKNMFKD